MTTKYKQPPRFAKWLLKWLSIYQEKHSISGDIEEIYYDIYRSKGYFVAIFWFWFQTFISLFLYFRILVFWSFIMLKNYLKVGLRTFNKQKGYSFINIFGLSIGLVCCLLIFLFVEDELSFDNFHVKKDRIYRVVTDRYSTNGWPIGSILENVYPEVEKNVYIRFLRNYSVLHEGQHFYDRMIFADPNLFEIFSFFLKEGDPKTALENPFSIVITENMERKYFGNRSAMGQSLILQDSLRFMVTGIMQEIPQSSHIQTDMILSFSTWSGQNPDFGTNSHWLDLNMVNYILLAEGASVSELEQKVSNIYMQYAGDYFKKIGSEPELHLEPLNEIYLYSKCGNGLGPRSDVKYIYLFSSIAIFILLIACINFMNLATARSIQRAKEVGVRKVVGSNRTAIINQFLTETYLTCIIALIFAFIILLLIFPEFNNLTGKEFSLSHLYSSSLLLFYFGFTIILGLLSGIYPAFALSSFKPVQVFNQSINGTNIGTKLRKVLVVFQFTISCTLIICTLIILRQLNFMQQKDLGFTKEQILVMDTRQTEWSVRSGQYQTIKQELSKNPNVFSVTATQAPPGHYGFFSILTYSENQSPNESKISEYLAVDHDYINTMGIEVIAGRDFSEDITADAKNALIVNETFVDNFKLDSPAEALGKQVKTLNGMLDHTIIGVVKNYHHHGLQKEYNPIMMEIQPWQFRFFALQIDPKETSSIISYMQEVWDQFFPSYSYTYFFLDDEFGQQYLQERQLAKIFAFFSTLAIVIGCLGLFGLAAFSAEKRTKEIGIRKVLGSSVSGIIKLLSKEFLLLVLIANVIAWPIAYYFMNQWLQNFAFRTNLSWWVFISTGILATFIALIAVSYQSIKTALTNPINSLKYE